MLNGYRYRGRHRAPPTPHTAARGAVVGAIAVALPLALSPAAAAEPGVWDRVAKCESGGNWQINTGNGYYGGLQFLPATWRGFGGGQFAPNAHQASREEQIKVAQRVLASQGPGAWPVCSRKAGLTRADGGGGSDPAPRSRPADPTPAPPTSRAPRQRGTSIPDGYRVRPGDTLSKIAKRYGVPGGYRAVAAANGIGNPNLIYPGQRLR